MGNYRNRVVGAAAFLVAAAPMLAAGAPQKPYTTWSDYGGAADSMQYSALKQIDKSKVRKLELARSYLVPDRRGNFGFNPIVVDGVMDVLGHNNAIVALDAATGKHIWSHPADDTIVTQRGINSWQNKDGSDRRLIFAAGQYLTEINARTGVTVNTFGNDGRVNMRVGELRPLGGPSATPGRVFENLLIVGSQTGEMYGSAPGDVRAYDVVTGKLVWTFHTIPHPGEFGYDTWSKDAWTYVGGVNTWGEVSIDQKRGIAYFPLGSPTHDMYGGDRKGAGLYGDFILALDIRTRKRLWHFQVVHHDLWDYDPTTAPKLLTVRHDDKPVDIVALPTKFGLLYVFNRVTGEPLWPIEERPVPKSDVPGEESWPTQPFPTKPPPFARLQFTVDDINPYVHEAERAKIRETSWRRATRGCSRRKRSAATRFPCRENWEEQIGAVAPRTRPPAWLYVRMLERPGFRTLSLPGARAVGRGTPAQRGMEAFTELCQNCHGEAGPNGIHSMDRLTMIPVKELGADRIRRTVRGGIGQMPPFEDDELTDANLDALVAYLQDPAPGRRGGGGRYSTPVPPPPQGVTRYTGPLGAMFRTANGLPAISPPWASIVAYNLNEGTIKWRVPLGTVLWLAAKGINDTGNSQRAHRNGPAVTAGGLIFVGSWDDRTVHAYDKDTGKILWEQELEANPEGIAAVYQVGAREYVAFCASGTAQQNGSASANFSFVPGMVDAQGYYVFALPKSTSSKN
jgi:quinoprotein glucose dehydrogenase